MEEAEASTDQSSCKVVVDEPVGSESREVEDKEPKPVRKPGEAAIKSQYVLKRKQSEDPLTKSDQTATDDGPPPAKRRKKKRGQNKRRPRAARVDLSDLLCPSLHHGKSSPLTTSCHFGDKCRYSHDCADFLSKKVPDISGSCYLFTTLGRCPYGLACRYGNSHMTSDQQNVTNEDLFDPNRVDTTRNVISKSLQEKLRKKKLQLPKSEKFLRECGHSADKGSGGKRQNWGGKDREDEGRDEGGKKEEGENGGEVTGGGEEGGKMVVGERSEAESERVVGEVSEAGDEELHSHSDGQCVEKSTSSIQSFTEAVNSSIQSFTEKDDSSIQSFTEPGVTVVSQSEEAVPSSGAVTDEDLIRLRPAEKKTVDFRDKLFLAPLTTVGNLPFRRICKGFGADITCGEMAMCTNLLQGQQSEWALLKRHRSEDVFGVQVCGAHVDSVTRCVEMISSYTEVDFIDLNVGCPIDLVFNKGAGCALMDRHTRFESIVRGMTAVVDCPITVKMRAGIHNRHWNAHKLAPKLRDWGVAMATVHGRSREQRYTKQADWDYIGTCAEAAAPMPLFGCGDMLSYEDYNMHRQQATGIMIARGALIKPWIFTEIKEQRHWDISSSERLDILRRYVNYGLEHWGSDTMGVENTRKFLLEWLSFLYRYVPVGLLEWPPQRINERPPCYTGRDELETLMASNNCQDWVKISEMLLGPVPGNFSFLPKHKANSYS